MADDDNLTRTSAARAALLLDARWPRWALEAALCCILGAMAWHTAASFRIKPVLAEEPASVAAPRAMTHPGVDAARAHLFGQGAEDQALPQAVSDAEVTVAGILFATDSKDSLAMLSIAGETTQSLGVGQSLTDGETIQSIEASAVVLSHFGNLRRIEMDIKQADPNARFGSLLNGGGSWADAYADGATDAPMEKPPAHGPPRIMSVPAAAPLSKTSGVLSLSQIRAQRASRLNKIRSPGVNPP